MDELRIKVMAAMETGNYSLARLVFRELLEINFTAASELKQDVMEAYQVNLLG